MKNIDIDELEKRYRSTSDVNELIELDRRYRHHLEDFIKTHPNDIQTLIHLGVLCWEPFHQHEKAIEYLQKAIEYDPQNVEARFWLAKCYYHDCWYEKAKKIVLEALEIDPTRADCLALLSSIIRDTTGSFVDSIHYLEKAVQSSPEWPMLRHVISTQYLEIKDIPSAELHLQKGLELAKIAPKKPKNAVEYYYESIVTGRSWPNTKERFEDLNERIQQEKKQILRSLKIRVWRIG